MHAIPVFSAEERAEALMGSRNAVARQVLREFIAYEPKRRNKCYVKGININMLNARQYAGRATVVHCLIERKKSGRHRQKKYEDAYARMMNIAAKRLIGNIRELLKHYS